MWPGLEKSGGAVTSIFVSTAHLNSNWSVALVDRWRQQLPNSHPFTSSPPSHLPYEMIWPTGTGLLVKPWGADSNHPEHAPLAGVFVSYLARCLPDPRATITRHLQPVLKKYEIAMSCYNRPPWANALFVEWTVFPGIGEGVGVIDDTTWTFGYMGLRNLREIGDIVENGIIVGAYCYRFHVIFDFELDAALGLPASLTKRSTTTNKRVRTKDCATQTKNCSEVRERCNRGTQTSNYDSSEPQGKTELDPLPPLPNLSVPHSTITLLPQRFQVRRPPRRPLQRQV